jgi:hypothetical protein
MTRSIRTLTLTGLLALASGLSLPGAAPGWLGVRNDTGAPVVVQTATVVNNTVRRGKPQLLQPGEVALDALCGPSVKRVTVYDPKRPNQPLFQDDVTCKGDDLFFSLRPEAVPVVKVGMPPPPPAPPTLKLVPAKPPPPTATAAPAPAPAPALPKSPPPPKKP